MVSGVAAPRASKVAIVISLSPQPHHHAVELTRIRQELRGETVKPEAQRFFGKGVIGDWQDYFDQRMLDDLENLRRNGFGIADAFMYKLIFDYRLRLKDYLLGRTGGASAFLPRW